MKRMLCMTLVWIMLFVMLPVNGLQVEAIEPDYPTTSSYGASAYYEALCNVELTGNQRLDIVNIALSQVGYREGSYYGDFSGADDGRYCNYTEYNYWYHNYVDSIMPVGGDGAPWCASFVSWCAEQADIPASILQRSIAAGAGDDYFNVDFYSGTSTLESHRDNNSHFKGYNYRPQKGDLFFTRTWSHVGLVVCVSGDYVITIEGNTNDNGSSQGNGVYMLSRRKIDELYYGVPNYVCEPIHTVDTNYGTDFSVYPKAEITYENIFDEYHDPIDAALLIEASDECTIHEVYTDGCCKVTFPLDEGGTITAYSKISLFELHKHDFTGERVYESAHPHAIVQRCVDYETCGGWEYTGEFYEVKTCEQCWYADIQIGASSLMIKMGESEMVSMSIDGCLPDTAEINISYDADVIEVSIEDQQITFTGIATGTTYFVVTIFSDNTKAQILGSANVMVTVAYDRYTVSYDANGGSNAPDPQIKWHEMDLALSGTVPVRNEYRFLGWATNPDATTPEYQPGDIYSDNADITLYAVWEHLCAKGHSYGEWVVVKKPTTTETGLSERVCATCGHKEQAVIEPLPERLGDVNGDGAVDTTDAKLIMQFDLGVIAGDALILPCADVNGDGTVDTTDAKLIMQYDLGMITEFP